MIIIIIKINIITIEEIRRITEGTKITIEEIDTKKTTTEGIIIITSRIDTITRSITIRIEKSLMKIGTSTKIHLINNYIYLFL